METLQQGQRWNCALISGLLLASQEAESEGRHENLRDSREVRRPHQQQRTILSSGMRGDVHRPDLATFTPQLLTIYKVEECCVLVEVRCSIVIFIFYGIE
jgi:hypothetical protein